MKLNSACATEPAGRISTRKCLVSARQQYCFRVFPFGHMEINPRAIKAVPTPTHCRRLNFSLRNSHASKTVAAG